METRRIVYPNTQTGGVCVIYTTGELPFEDVCQKDVPDGLPYLIMEDSELPTDNAFFNAWQADFSKPHGHGLGYDKWKAIKDKEKEKQRKMKP